MAKLRTIVVGTGSMGGLWTRVVNDCPGTALVGLVDLDPDAPARVMERVGIAGIEAFSDLGRAIETTRADLVVDCTIPAAHHDVTITALKRGCHVIGEKPLADSMKAAREMVDAARRADRIYMVSQNRRFEPRIQAIRKAILGGRIGAVTSIDADFYIGMHFGGFREEMAHPLIVDMAIHHFDMARYLSGLDGEAVYARAFNPKGSWYKGEAAASAIFEMTGDAVFNYRGSWCSICPPTSWNAAWRILGEKGCILWDGEDPPRLFKEQRTQSKRVACRELKLPLRSMKHTGQAEALREFLRALKAGRQPSGWCGDNIKSLAMVYGAVSSSDEGRRGDCHAALRTNSK